MSKTITTIAGQHFEQGTRLRLSTAQYRARQHARTVGADGLHNQPLVRLVRSAGDAYDVELLAGITVGTGPGFKTGEHLTMLEPGE